jgi:hypothetical protein
VGNLGKRYPLNNATEVSPRSPRDPLQVAIPLSCTNVVLSSRRSSVLELSALEILGSREMTWPIYPGGAGAKTLKQPTGAAAKSTPMADV